VTTLPGSHVADSVEAAITALEHLAASLREGGFAEGASSYQRMADVLLAQRVFYAAGGGSELPTERFDHLGEVAREVYELLEPYAGAMRRLAAMAPERLDEKAVAAVRIQLEKRGNRGATASVLSRSAHVPRETTDAVLASFVADGTVQRRAAGDVESFRLALAPRSR
jgi:hypothetical protein